MKNSNNTPPTSGPNNSSFWEAFKKIFSKISHNTHDILERSSINQIISALSDKDTSDVEKMDYIETLPMLNVGDIIPLLENTDITRFHLYLIEHKLANIDLWQYQWTLFQKKTDLHKLLESEKIGAQTLYSIFRQKNSKKHSFEIVYSFLQSSKISDEIKGYFVNRFLEEQDWEGIKKLIKKFRWKSEDFYIIEALVQSVNLIEFTEIIPHLQDPKISHRTKQYLSWKCTNVSLEEFLNLLESPHNIWDSETIKNLAHKCQKTATLENIKKFKDKPFFPYLFAILNPEISDEDIDKFCQEHVQSSGSLKIIFGYRMRNYENFQKQSELYPKKDEEFSFSNFFAKNGEPIFHNDKMLKTFLSSYAWDSSAFWSMILGQAKQRPKENIYSIERSNVQKFLQGHPKIPENIRSENNNKILNYQKQFLTQKELQDAKNIWIDTDNFELTLYSRYHHAVDYPEIADFIAIFIDEYIHSGRSKIFKNFRILPRNFGQETNIEPLLKELKTAKYYNLIGPSAPVAMNVCSSTMYLSHSANAGKYNIPNIISTSMHPKAKENDILSNIELELEKTPQDNQEMIMKKVDSFTICLEVLKNIQNLEDKLLQLADNQQKANTPQENQ